MTMRYFSPDTSNAGGGDAGPRPVGAVPSGMDTDPNADEEIIDQQSGREAPRDQYPEPVNAPKIAPDNLADSIAYALDGSGPGPANDTPNGSGHKVVAEGITGASLEDEDDDLQS